jgi:predicted kinase
MGTGKTTVAKALAGAQGWPVIHSDAVRKTLAGLTPTTRVPLEFGAGIYSPEFSRRTYAEMRRLARECLEESPGVILDGSYKSAAERALVRELAEETGAKAVFVHCTCPREVVRQRLLRRTANTQAISDGRLELQLLQAEDFEPLGEEDQPLLKLDTGGEPEEVLAELQGFLSRQLEE